MRCRGTDVYYFECALTKYDIYCIMFYLTKIYNMHYLFSLPQTKNVMVESELTASKRLIYYEI